MKQKIWAALELMRPANILTAFADILAGFAVAGGVIHLQSAGVEVIPGGLGWLLIATFGLYGGGIVFNDVFDAGIDAVERPERPVPSGRISKTGASLLGTALFLIGCLSAYRVNDTALILAAGITISALIYDAWAKHSAVSGPFFMGLCRGGNLMLGASLVPVVLFDVWFIGLFPLLYISAITLISRGEVEGGRRHHGITALIMIVIVILAVPALALQFDFNVLIALPFLALFSWMVIPPFLKASQHPDADNIRTAVKRGVVSLVIFNSVLAAGFAGWVAGLLVLLLFPFSVATARLFSVT
jgi:4-hydroxybenzoate polyprenyltransferase